MTDEAMLEDGTPVSIQQVLAMDPEPPLRCPGVDDHDAACERVLHVRARDSDLVAAHFFGHHIDGCTRSSIRSDDAPGDAGHTVLQGRRASKWLLQLDESARTDGLNGRRRPDERIEGTRTRRHAVDARRPPANTTDAHTLSNVLAAALSDQLPQVLALPGQPFRPSVEVVVPVSDATADRFATGDVLIWGRVASVRSTPWGGTMLLLNDAADGLAVLLPKELRGWFPLAQDREFIGRFVITVGTPTGTTKGKQYIRVPSRHSVAFDPGVRLRVELSADIES